MTRKIFYLSLAIFLAVNGVAQTQQTNQAPQPQRFSLGLKMGPSVTFATYPDQEQRDLFSTKPKLGYGGAGFIIFPLSKSDYSFVAEGGYAVRGRKIKNKEDHLTNNSTYQFVDMSMALRRSFELRLKKNVPTRWFVNVGPNVQYWLSGKGKFVETKYNIVFLTSPETPPTGDLFTNYLIDANRWLFGVDFGIGMDAPITKIQKIKVELRVTLGQTFLGKKGSFSSYQYIGWRDPLKTNMKTVSLTGAYTFDFDMRARKLGHSTKDRTVKTKGRRR